MAMAADDFDTEVLPIIGPYNVMRFRQWSPEDSANWIVQKGNDGTKRPFSMYPAMGRAHINYIGQNVLQFAAESRGLFKSINFWYNVVGNIVYRVDNAYNQTPIGTLLSSGGNVFFAYLVVNKIVFACFVDTQKIYVYQEDVGTFSIVTDSNAPGVVTTMNSDGTTSVTKPGYIAAFGNRIVVSVADSSQFYLSTINLLNNAGVFDPATCFTTAGAAVFAQEDNIIGQMAVLNNTLYIFCSSVTGLWSNRASTLSNGVSFPWQKNTSYSWNFGIADPLSLDVSFGMMAFIGQSGDGLLQAMVSTGAQPKPISSKAIDVLLQRYSNRLGNQSPFLSGNAEGFLYQYENTIFYRLSGGPYTGTGLLDQEFTNNSIEYNFDTETWHRLIERNGERCRIQKQIFFNNQHLVSVLGDTTIYQMSGQFYYNEITNPSALDPQSADAYLQEPFRYERVSPIISLPDYAEFEDQYVEIDFVFGDSNINFSTAPFQNAQFLIDEQAAPDGSPQYIVAETLDSDGQPIFILAEQGNTPQLNELTYNALYKPTIELFWSDDGGISFNSADVREFSQMGVYQWRMRWYQLGTSRNRVYKLVAISPVPIVILGGTRMTRRISGGAN